MSSLKANIKLIDGRNVDLDVVSSDLIKDIKKRVAQKFYKDYLPEQTVLEFEGNVVKDNLALSDNIFPKNAIIRLAQRKAEIWEVSGLNVDPDKQDPITCEKGVAKLNCGHQISRSALSGVVETSIKNGDIEFFCPIFSNGARCSHKFTAKEISLICGFSRQQVENNDDRLNQIWVDKNTQICPGCKEVICITGLTTRRVRCPGCDKEDICFDCLQKWKADSNGKCTSYDCTQKNNLVQTGGFTRQFKVRDKSGNYITVMTPEFRACPRCGNIVNNYQACKHTPCTCMKMGYSFCFICLGLYENGKWPCGSHAAYCGNLAPIQSVK